MNKYSLLLIAIILANFSFAQDEKAEVEEDENNLVPNGSFEKYGEGLRRVGEFGLTESWENASMAASDLFATETRSKYVKIPENVYGYEEPYEGNNYASIVTYSYRHRKIKKSYITVELKSKLKENNLYCLKFRASLSERSTYATNNLGMVLTKSKVSEKTENTIRQSNVQLSDKNDVVTQRDGWWEFCKRYAAKGNEKYLTIGNFTEDNNTVTEQMELPSKYAEEGPEAVALYYIDAVEVRHVESDQDCGCANTKIPESKVIYSASVQINDEMTATEKVEAVDAYFYQYQDEVVSNAKRSIDKIIEMMKANPAMNVQIIGHMDNEEMDLSKSEYSLKDLDEKRAMNVLTYMVQEGIDRSRISTKGEKNKKPVSTMSTPISLAKNRRVEFKIAL